MLTPRIETVVTEAGGGVSLAKVKQNPQGPSIWSWTTLIAINIFQVDIDEHNDLAFEFDVSSVPVLVGMRNGVEVARMVGLQDKDKLKKFVEILANSKWLALCPCSQFFKLN